MPHRAKPQTQGLAGAMKNRAGRYGSLDPTLLATPKPPVRPPRFIRSALRAHKPIRPTQSRQVFQASSLGRKPLLKLRQRPGIVFHDQTLHFVVTGVNPIPPFLRIYFLFPYKLKKAHKFTFNLISDLLPIVGFPPELPSAFTLFLNHVFRHLTNAHKFAQ